MKSESKSIYLQCIRSLIKERNNGNSSPTCKQEGVSLPNLDEDFIPISIERNPQIMKRKSLIKLLPKDLSEVRTFIKQNLVNLYNLADRQISQIEFSLKIDKITRATNEARGFLTNMKKVFNKLGEKSPSCCRWGMNRHLFSFCKYIKKFFEFKT